MRSRSRILLVGSSDYVVSTYHIRPTENSTGSG
jgi:hypothetical protein